VRLAALWSWALSFATVVVAGYAIELARHISALATQRRLERQTTPSSLGFTRTLACSSSRP